MLFIFSTPVLIRYLCQLKTVVFLHWCLLCAVPLNRSCQKRRERTDYQLFAYFCQNFVSLLRHFGGAATFSLYDTQHSEHNYDTQYDATRRNNTLRSHTHHNDSSIMSLIARLGIYSIQNKCHSE